MVLFALFSSVCVTAGLFYFSEYIEDHPAVARRYLTHAIHFTALSHIMLMVFEREIVGFLPALIGLLSHLAYWNMMHTFPLVSLNSSAFFAACGMFVLSNVVWVHALAFTGRVTSFVACVVIFALVELIPVVLLISLQTNDDFLPFSSNSNNHNSKLSSTAPATSPASKKERKSVSNILRAAVAWLRGDRGNKYAHQLPTNRTETRSAPESDMSTTSSFSKNA